MSSKLLWVWYVCLENYLHSCSSNFCGCNLWWWGFSWYTLNSTWRSFFVAGLEGELQALQGNQWRHYKSCGQGEYGARLFFYLIVSDTFEGSYVLGFVCAVLWNATTWCNKSTWDLQTSWTTGEFLHVFNEAELYCELTRRSWLVGY